MILEDLQPAFLPQVYLVLLSVQSEVGGLPISSACRQLSLELGSCQKVPYGNPATPTTYILHRKFCTQIEWSCGGADAGDAGAGAGGIKPKAKSSLLPQSYICISCSFLIKR